MGVYLNDPGVCELYREESSLTYYVDKTEIIREFIPLMENDRDAVENTKEYGVRGPKYI